MFDMMAEDAFYEFPSFEVALFSILLSFALSTVMAFTYHFTNKGSAFSRNFFQAMVLSSIVSCMVIMAVGNNLAAGFGIIGAIAIIRFRMRIENPRNIIFIFASLSVGIAAGVYGYYIALAGTAVFCLVVVLLYYSPYGTSTLSNEYELVFTLLSGSHHNAMINMLREHCLDFRMIRVISNKKGDRFVYFVTLKQGVDRDIFYADLKQREGLSNIRLERSDNLRRL